MGKNSLCCVIYCYFIATAFMFLICGRMVSIWTESTDFNLDYDTGFMNQVSSDWATEPFYKVWTTNNTNCGNGADEVFYRPFYGSSFGCDCLGIFSIHMTGDNLMIWGWRCDRN